MQRTSEVFNCVLSNKGLDPSVVIIVLVQSTDMGYETC